MEDLFSPEQVKLFISLAKTDRQKVILFFMYNFGMTVEEVLAIKKKNFVITKEHLIFTFTRISTEKSQRVKIDSGDYYRILYKILTKLTDDGAPLIHKGKGTEITSDALKKDLFAVAVETNQKITISGIFDSHLYWLFRKGLNYNHAIEEYGIRLSDRYLKLYERAFSDGRIIPRLLK